MSLSSHHFIHSHCSGINVTRSPLQEPRSLEGGCCQGSPVHRYSGCGKQGYMELLSGVKDGVTDVANKVRRSYGVKEGNTDDAIGISNH